MPFRIREILLVSSAYDAFVLEEDGSLSDRLFYEYSELSLSWAPRITHAAGAVKALELLNERRFDLVITVVRIGAHDAEVLSRQVKAQHHDVPVALLIFDEADLKQFAGGQAPTTIDRVFQWTGNHGVLIAMIKSIEDQRNVEHDTTTAGVQVILVIEDRVRAYSSFLGLLYPELLAQSGSLIAEGLNDFHRRMRMRARPKILLANEFEGGLALFEKYASSMCAVMTDVRIPREGRIAPEGGLDLVRKIRDRDSRLPIMFMSAEPHEMAAQQLRAHFADKNARNFRARLRLFLAESLGFGDFVFRLPDRTEVARASDVYEMEQALSHVPAQSVAYHANRNHFSVWLRARSLFEIAANVKPRMVTDFDDVEELRLDLIGVLQTARLREQAGVITDLYSRHTGPDNRFVRIGRGSIGGKGRSVAFVSTLIVRHNLLDRFDGLQVRIPKTVVLGTDAFDSFMEQIDVDELLSLDQDTQVSEWVMAGKFDDALLGDLQKAFGILRGPLAVRSSSLLEDSRFQPFAGVYATYMLPNNDPDPRFRFQELLRAIKAVYASAFWQDARTYLAGTPHDADDQKMAVVIQQVVGRAHGERFYPPMSGVAQSYNYYPIGGQTAEDGVAHVALGLGHTVVGGGVALRFSPGAPTVLPQFPTAESFLQGSQLRFQALDLSRPRFSWSDGPEASLVSCDLSDAETDGTLQLVGSVYDATDDIIRENFRLKGPRLVTFNNILKWNSLPLADALTRLMGMLRESMGEEVEIEFALDVPSIIGPPNRTTRLYVLQVRPMTAPDQRQLHHDLDQLDRELLLCRTDVALGHGSYTPIRDIIQVRASRLNQRRSRELARRVGDLNKTLSDRPYLLVGPGRWGSTDPTLGVGVTWADIAGAAVIMEVPIGKRRIEPSQGTHFFRNITASRIGYLSVSSTQASWLDEAWLEEHSMGEEDAVRHIQLVTPIAVHIDGRKGKAVILKNARHEA
jgi:CheY-like chemotaxis protein